MDTEIQIQHPASFWERLGAKACDIPVTMALQLLVFFALSAIDIAGLISGKTLALALFWLSVLATTAYFLSGSFGGRRTLGYRLAGIQMQRLDGSQLSFEKGLARTLLSLLGQTLSYLGWIDFLWITFNKSRRALHDIIVGTKVVKVGKPNLFGLIACPTLAIIVFLLWSSHLVPLLPFQVFYLPSSSMSPTLKVNDRILTNALYYRFRDPKDGDIAIFKAPPDSLLNGPVTGDVDFVKRVVGSPGETVEMKKGHLFVNGKAVSEPFAKWSDGYVYDMKIVGNAVYSRDHEAGQTSGMWARNDVFVAPDDQLAIDGAPAGKVPAGKYLTLGDNRGNSNDSHLFGFVPRSNFRARAFFNFWPLSHWRDLYDVN